MAIAIGVSILVVAAIAFTVIDVQTDNRLLKRWAPELRSAHLKTVALYIAVGLIPFFGLTGLGAAVEGLTPWDPSSAASGGRIPLGVAAQTALFGYSLRHRPKRNGPTP